jgi:hypothetical protein
MIYCCLSHVLFHVSETVVGAVDNIGIVTARDINNGETALSEES